MDDRKKRIEDLHRNNRESRASLDTLLENFGEKLYSRTRDQASEYENYSSYEDINLYNKYLQDIKESNASIIKIEEKNRRYKELIEVIDRKESEEKERGRNIAATYRRLGKALLENSTYNDFTSFFKEQYDTYKAKRESLENRISELDNKEGGNVFTWIGKSAQGLVLKSFLSKALDNLEQLYYTIGERYGNREPISYDDDVAMILAELEILTSASKDVQDEISELNDEKRIITAGFGIDGNPQKQISSVKNHIAQVNDSLGSLYRNFGSQAAGIKDAEINPDRKYFIDTIVTAEDSEIIGRAGRLHESIINNAKAIEKLTASLKIDEEKSKIEKYHRSIEDKRKRIVDLEKGIADLEDSVSDCRKYIQELEKQL